MAVVFHRLTIFSTFVALSSAAGCCKKDVVVVDGCSQYVTKLLNVLSVMCENIGLSQNSTTTRDACLGCFQRAVSADNGQPSITQLRACAMMYLQQTPYRNCLPAIGGTIAPTPPTNGVINPRYGRSVRKCVSGYCQFVSCVRGVNGASLINRCEGSVGNTTNLVYIHGNVTACVLAIARCSTINPITGEPQNPSAGGYFNTLNIGADGNLRILSIPESIAIQNQFCTTSSPFSQANFRNYTC